MPTLLWVLLALLAGLATGKAWERYKLRDGRLIDRRKARQTPHYLLGLNYVVTRQIDAAIEQLAQAAATEPEAIEIQLILGDLYREKGQVGRAIQIHQQLLQHPKLPRREHVYVLLSLGHDFKRGGFVDRAVSAFDEVLQLDADNEHALQHLEKLHQEQHQWAEARAIRERLMQQGSRGGAPRDRAILGFLENELGLAALKGGDASAAASHFQAAIDLDRATVPAYLNLGDVRRDSGNQAVAIAAWEKLVQVAPDRAWLAFGRLEAAYAHQGTADRFPELCRRLIDGNPQEWRARAALARHLVRTGAPLDAFELLLQALSHNPHAISIHQEIWDVLTALRLDPDLVSRYIDLTRGAVFYLDPHVCINCRYRSTELLWQCPQCHEWNTFVEERIAPAKDEE